MIRNPEKALAHKSFQQISETSSEFPISIEFEANCGPFEKIVVKAKLLASEPSDYAHHNVFVASSNNKLSNGDFFIEDCVTTVQEEGSLYLHCLI